MDGIQIVIHFVILLRLYDPPANAFASSGSKEGWLKGVQNLSPTRSSIPLLAPEESTERVPRRSLKPRLGSHTGGGSRLRPHVPHLNFQERKPHHRAVGGASPFRTMNPLAAPGYGQSSTVGRGFLAKRTNARARWASLVTGEMFGFEPKRKRCKEQSAVEHLVTSLGPPQQSKHRARIARNGEAPFPGIRPLRNGWSAHLGDVQTAIS